MADAVALGGLAGRDRGPDDGREERLGAPQPPGGPLFPQPGEVGQLPLAGQQVDHVGIDAVQGEHEDPVALRLARAAGEEEAQQEGGEPGGHGGDATERGAVCQAMKRFCRSGHVDFRTSQRVLCPKEIACLESE
jgi:hypothetical protein